MVETKVKAGTAVGGLVGLAAWALVTFIPAFKNGLPQPVMDALPFILAWIGHTAAAYLAPHTHRPDLPGSSIKPASATGDAGMPMLNIPASGVTRGGVQVILTPSLGPVFGTMGGPVSAVPDSAGTTGGPASAATGTDGDG